jgi:hypothetical protein
MNSFKNPDIEFNFMFSGRLFLERDTVQYIVLERREEFISYVTIMDSIIYHLYLPLKASFIQLH